MPRLPWGKKKRVACPPDVQFLLVNRRRIQKFYPCRLQTDTPLASIYRMYVAIVGGNDLWLRSEVEIFFRKPTWSIIDIPDPKDTIQARYAVLAAIPYLLVKAFNRNINMGLPRDAPSIFSEEEEAEFRARPKKLEMVPGWAQRVPAMKERIEIPDGRGQVPKDEHDERADKDMLRKNILTITLPVFFI